MRKRIDENGNNLNQCSYFFLSEKAARNLPHYQYKGEDRSLLYYYVLSPLAAFCVNRLTPRWLAPNTITLFGLAWMVAAYMVMWFYSPTLEPTDTPRWIFLFNGIAMLAYQTLDNMDGKQSRRTGSSSPLGLLFDHGCDAINPLFGSVNWMIAMSLDPVSDAWLCFIILFGPYALFYVGTWEEYYTGELIMPIFNGPSEGILGGAFLSFTSYQYGPGYWLESSWWSDWILPVLSPILPALNLDELPALRNADVLVILSSIGFIQETFLKALYVARTYGSRALLNLVPFLTWIQCFLIVGVTDLNIWLDCPRLSLHLCALLFAEMTTDLMLCHVTDENFQPVRWTLAPLVLFTLLTKCGVLQAGELSQDYLLLYASALGAYLCLKMVVVIHELCSVLQIWCFDIVTPRGALVSSNGHAKIS